MYIKSMQRVDTFLSRVQGITLALIPILAAHTGLVVVGAVDTRLPIIFELRGIVFKLADIPFFTLMIVTAGRWLIRPQWQPTHYAWLALCGWMAVSVLWAEQPVIVAYQAIYTALLVIMAIVLAHRGRNDTILLVVSLAAAGQALIAVGQSLNNGSIGLVGLGEATFTGRHAQGLTYNPNTLASYMVIGLFMAGVLYGQQRKRWQLGLVGVIGLGIAATHSIGAMIAVAVGLVWVFGRRWMLVVMAAGGLLLAATNATMQQRVLFAWPATFRVMQSAPINGVGAGNLMFAVDELAAGGQISVYDHSSYGFLQPAHNAYAALWGELGGVGLALMLIGVWPLLREKKPSLASGCMIAIGTIMLFEYHFWLDAHWRMIALWVIGWWWSSTEQDKDTSSLSAIQFVNIF